MSASPFIHLSVVLLGGLLTWAQTEMKKVAGVNATLPCHHQLWVGDDPTLDIEWLLLKPTSRKRVVITFFAGRVFDPSEADRGRVAFAGDFLKGDASLLIRDVSLTDAGEYSCKVKTGSQYHWSTISLTVLVKPSRPRCWMEGNPSEGGDVKMSCKSADGSEPILYRWERVLEKGRSASRLPPLARIDWKKPESVTLRNLTKDNSGVYRCTASNDVGAESCTLDVKICYVKRTSVVVGAVVAVSAGVLLIILIIWMVIRRKDMEKYEEEETPNEIREDAEAPKAKLMKPSSSSSSHSGSSRSGSSSSRSMVNTGAFAQPAGVAAIMDDYRRSTFPQPGYKMAAVSSSTAASTSASNSNLPPPPHSPRS